MYILQQSNMLYVNIGTDQYRLVDANEIEAKARLGGFTDIKREPFKTWEKIGNKDFCLITIKMIMIKAVKK